MDYFAGFFCYFFFSKGEFSSVMAWIKLLFFPRGHRLSLRMSTLDCVCALLMRCEKLIGFCDLYSGGECSRNGFGEFLDCANSLVAVWAII